MRLPGRPRGEYDDEGEGEGERELSGEEEGEWSGLLAGVAVGENIGVGRVEGVTALIPLSLSIFARPSDEEKVLVELRRDRAAGVDATLDMQLLVAVHIWLPR